MSMTHRRALLCGLLTCISVSAAAADYGRTQGSFNVSGGSATYTIPIWTPPGPNGVTPHIALSYDSQSDNGIGGVGWNLSAAASIERCNRTGAQDGYGAPVDLSMNDRFCIAGNKLRSSSGTYGAAGSVYFTEIADYSRITAYGTVGNGPQYFIVEAKSGLRYEYGAAATARVALGGTVLRWMLNKVYDRSGNNYVVSYNNTGGLAVPDVISWTPTSLGSASYRYEAKFNYLTTRTDADSFIGRVAGYDIANRYRLENIQIKSVGAVVRKYRFTYNTSAASARSLLASAKECADDAESNCLLPITFTYQPGQTGVVSTAATGISGSSSLVRGKYDFNGDGKSDLLYVSGGNWNVSFSTGSGFTAGVNTGVASSAIVFPQRFLATHQDGLLVNVGNAWQYVGYNGGSFSSQSTGVPGNITTLTDNNGDGLADIVWSTNDSVMLRINNTSASATVPSFAAATVAATFNVGQGNVTIINGEDCPIDRTCDINGDGRADLMVHVTSVTNCGFGGCVIVNSESDLYASGNGYSTGTPWGVIGYRGIHFNDDRCIDRVPNYTTNLLVAACNGTFTTLALPAAPVTYIDWNNDGKTDLLVNNGGLFGVYLSKGNTASPFTALIPTTIPVSSSCSYFVLDADGDGLDDVGCVGTTAPFAVSYYPRSGSGGVYLTQQPDLLSSILDGFGVTISPSYVSTAENNYTRGTGTQLPLVDTTEPITVVAQVSSSNGVGGTYTKTYNYTGARTNGARDEFAGFQRIDETDSRNGLISRIYFEQTFPVAGMVSQQELMQPDGTTPVSRTVIANTFTTLDSTPSNQRYFLYPSASTATQYEAGGFLNGNLLRTLSTTYKYDSASGTLYDQNTYTDEPGSANGDTNGGSWTERDYTPLASLVNDTANWCLGRPGQLKRERSHNLVFGDYFLFTTDITWNGLLCRPTQTIDEAGRATLQITTDIGYDGFGHVSSTTVTGIGMAPRTSSTSYSDATFTTGQFPLSVTNALNQTSTSAWNYDVGVPTSTTDPNGLITSWLYDPFGRRTKETRTDGTATTLTYNNCTAVAGGCVGTGNKTVLIETALTSSGNVVNDVWRYLDAFDRPIVAKTRTLSGAYNRVDQQYDALGRLYRQSAPCLWTSCTTYWITNTYDLLNRPITTTRPVSEIDPTLQTTTLSYEGLTTRLTDAQGKQTVRVLNAFGEVFKITDHDGYSQWYEYYVFSNLARVNDSQGNILQTSIYNDRAMLTDRNDRDMGAWTFTPNALGEVVSQTDAKGQTTTFGYDLLGRLTSRIEAEGTSTWTWGTSASAKNIGQLASLSGPGYSETYTYNALGQVNARSITADSTTYLINFGYTTGGQLANLTYPTSTSSYRLKLKFDYQNGDLYRISDFNAASTVFWTATAANSRDQITQESLGNGLVSNRAFDAVTGWIKSIQTGVGGGTGVQNLAYTWDKAGNLSSRKDVNQANLTETFFYDNLYRLDYSKLNGVTNLDLAYDGKGNITSKSDVGTYTYHPSKTHQVASTSNGWTFSYDANGNMQSGAGRTNTWTSYNYLASVANGTNTAAFSYTPDRQYYKQVSNYASGGAATTVYVGGLLEKVTTGSVTDYRHMIRAGTATIILSRQSNGTNTVNYVTSDHLGSSSAITNSSGGILVNSSFDAFGKRRGSNWSGSPSSADWNAIASTTRRGYTEHSMLDNLNLIHMNGRVQDPTLGRFASADPFISQPGFTQNYNRYSYVDNNALSRVDPSGFCFYSFEPVRTNTPYPVRTNSTGNVADAVVYDEIVVTAIRTPCPGMEPVDPPRGPGGEPLLPNPNGPSTPGDMPEVVVTAKRPQEEPTVCTRPSLGEAKISLGAQLGFSARLPGRAVTINGDINLYSWSQSSNEHFARVGQSFGGGFSLFGFGPNFKTDRSVPAIGDYGLSRASFSDTQYGTDLETHLPGSNTELSTPEDILTLAVGAKALIGLELRLNLLELFNRTVGIDSCD